MEVALSSRPSTRSPASVCGLPCLLSGSYSKRLRYASQREAVCWQSMVCELASPTGALAQVEVGEGQAEAGFIFKAFW